MADDTVPYTYCYVCRKQLTLMKRCMRCRNVIYCSRVCQVQDWPRHKENCGADESSTVTLPCQSMTSLYTRNDNSIFENDEGLNMLYLDVNTGTQKVHPPLVDFNKAVQKLQSSNPTKQSPTPQDANTVNQTEAHSNKTYLCNNEFYSDIPKLDENAPWSDIVVKCNKVKHKISVQNSWTGDETCKHLSHSLSVPLEKLKLIHKGKVLTKDSIMETIKDKAVYIAFGEKAESDVGIDQRDITVMMQQMGVDRNKAIQTLKQKGDLIDALLS